MSDDSCNVALNNSNWDGAHRFLFLRSSTTLNFKLGLGKTKHPVLPIVFDFIRLEDPLVFDKLALKLRVVGEIGPKWCEACSSPAA